MFRSRRRSPGSRWASSTKTGATSPSPTSSVPRTRSATWTSRSQERAKSVTALQLDTKIDGLPADVLAQGAAPGHEGATHDPEGDGRTRSRLRVPRSSDNAPKIVSFEIPIDRIGEVIGPKGKVINALQAETGADIAVDDDGTIGVVTIGAKESTAVEDARRRIAMIIDPPEAEVGAIYPGKVVNITKFGAFVNILPGRDGLLHISKLGGGKRVERVESVLTLGQEVDVKVDDIDPQGKVSLSLVGEPAAPDRADAADAPDPGGVQVVSFEADFEEELTRDLGDLGPAPVTARDGGERPDRGGPRRPARRTRR